jgi:arginyl-tRNA synthetase
MGFGTINGSDGTPLKSRTGGAASLQSAIDDIYSSALINIETSKKILSSEEKNKIAKDIALASLKFADLSNLLETDYIFLPTKFTSFEGKTGAYILYCAVRIKSILSKIENINNYNIVITNKYEKDLAIKLLEFSEMINYC